MNKSLGPDENYRDYPEYSKYSREDLRKIIFFQGLKAPEHYLGESPYCGEEATWWYEGKKFWTALEEGADHREHPYFKGVGFGEVSDIKEYVSDIKEYCDYFRFLNANMRKSLETLLVNLFDGYPQVLDVIIQRKIQLIPEFPDTWTIILFLQVIWSEGNAWIEPTKLMIVMQENGRISRTYCENDNYFQKRDFLSLVEKNPFWVEPFVREEDYEE